ncbi:Protein RER1 [Lemmus lemmus]
MIVGLSIVSTIRVYLLQGWYIVTFAMGIYYLNLFIVFLSPKVDPSLMEDPHNDGLFITNRVRSFALHSKAYRIQILNAATKGILMAMIFTFCSRLFLWVACSQITETY